jgi:hypothetical protein
MEFSEIADYTAAILRWQKHVLAKSACTSIRTAAVDSISLFGQSKQGCGRFVQRVYYHLSLFVSPFATEHRRSKYLNESFVEK